MFNSRSSLINLIALPIILSGCGSTPNLPLMFGQSHTVGISIGASTADQGGEFTLGYKDKNIAIIPVTVKQNDDGSTLIQAIINETDKGESTDAMSVIGQFEVSSDTDKGNVGLGKFFATGIAAQQLSHGFRQKISGEADSEPKEPELKEADAEKDNDIEKPE